MGVGAIVLVTLLILSQAAWQNQVRYSDGQRAQQPPDLEWVDHATGDDVGILNTSSDNRAFQVTAFFDERILGSYDVGGRIAPLGRECTVALADNGALSGQGCELPATLLLENTVTRPRCTTRPSSSPMDCGDA